MDIAALNLIISARIDEFEAAMEEMERGIGRAGKAAQEAGGQLTKYVTVPLGLLAAASLKAAGDIQALEKGFAATYKGSEDLGTALGKVRELAKLPGLGLQEALQGATNLQAAGLSADLARRALGAFGNALATVGKGKADLEGVGLALGQIQAKGKVSAEEINQLAERVPQIRQAMQAAFGTADTEALNKAGISATAFVEGVVTELERLPKVTGGINNAFENLGDGVTIALSKIGAVINKQLDIEGLLNRLGDTINSLGESFANLSPFAQKTILVLAGVAAAAGPVLVAIGTLGTATPAIVAGFGLLEGALASASVALEGFGIVSIGALGPVGVVVAAVAAAAALIITNWDEITQYFSASGEGGRVFGDLANSVSAAFDEIRAAASAVAGVFDGVFDGAFDDLNVGQAVLSALTLNLRLVAGTISGLATEIVAFGKLARAVFALDFAGAVSAAQLALEGFQKPIRAALGLLPDLTKDTRNFVETGINGANGFTDALTANLFAFGKLDEAAKNAAGNQIKSLGLLANLEKQLKDARTQQDNATNTADLTAANQLIASLEEQIKKYKALGIGSDEARKALEKFRESLALNDNLSRALGSSYDYLGGRQSALQSGIKNLIDAGWNPASKTVQDYVAQLERLNATMGATERLSTNLSGVKVSFDAGNAAKQLQDQVAESLNSSQLPQRLELTNLGDIIGAGAVKQRAAEYTAALESLTPAQRRALDSQVAFNTEMGDLIDSIGPRFAALGDAIGQTLASFATGNINAGQALAATLGSVIDALAEFMKDYGKKLIVLSGGDFALGNYAGGIAKIAAGTAIIAAAGLGAGLAKSAIGPGSSGGGGRIGSAVPTSNYRAPRAQTPTTAPSSANAAPSEVRHIMEVRVKGGDLVGALEYTTDRLGRIRGKG